ncbi:MAG TPA: hypothetical protein VL307_13150 [Chitinophagaceae bacterium]|nr:hypothetical protein [Chitinophagaceae bacterium]
MATEPSFNLQTELRAYFPLDFIKFGAIELGENEENLLRLIAASIPTVLLAITKKTASTASANGIHFLAVSIHNSCSPKENPQFFVASNSLVHAYNDVLVKEIMGLEFKPVIQKLAAYSSTKYASTRNVIEYTCSIAMISLGKHAQRNLLSPSEFKAWLHPQEEDFFAALPIQLTDVDKLLGSMYKDKRSVRHLFTNLKDFPHWLFVKKGLIPSLATILLLLLVLAARRVFRW